MSYSPDGLVNDARDGTGPCDGCPAQADNRSQRVHPGYFDYDSPEIMFIGIEPSHKANWDKYGTFEEYSDVSGEKFLHPDNGGRQLAQTLARVPEVGIKDTWVSDSIKCRPRGQSNRKRAAEFAHCKHHLSAEIEAVEPTVIVTLGKQTIPRVIDAVGADSSQISIASPKTSCGKILNTDPPIIVAPHWGHGHLRSRPDDEWGDGWAGDVSYLTRDSYGSHLQVVQEALQYAYVTF